MRRQLTRRLAEALVRHAVGVMPNELKHWAAGMQSELTYIAEDRAALRWAAGAVGAAYRTHVRHLGLLDVAAIRAAGVLLMLFRAFDVTLPSMLTLAYRMRSAAADSLGRMTPGDDYQRLIPLMEAIPAWLHGLLVAAGLSYLMTGVCLLRRSRTASLALLAGLVIELLSQAVARPILASTGVVATQNPSVLAAVLLPVVFPLLLAIVAWTGSRRDGGMTYARR